MEQQTPDPKKVAIKALVEWREKDRAAITDKADQGKQKTEYAYRKTLRSAADKLGSNHT